MSRRRRPASHHGLLLLDKPAGPTSHDVVQTARRALGQRQVGHTGTLDPPATGLLPLVLGRATRLARFLPGAPKRYTGVLRLGWTSSTDDAAGTLQRGHGAPPSDPALVAAAARALTGTIDQLPPAVSAKQVGGRRLHALAREGIEVERRPVRVTVTAFELEPTHDPERWRYTAVVSTGTYVRALARDLGLALGCGGHVDTLRRTTIGPYDVSDACAWPAEDEPATAALIEAIVPPDRLVLAMPAVRLVDVVARARFLSGGEIAPGGFVADPALSGPVEPDGSETESRRVADEAGCLLGVGEVADDALRPRVVVGRADGERSRQTAENA